MDGRDSKVTTVGRSLGGGGVRRGVCPMNAQDIASSQTADLGTGGGDAGKSADMYLESFTNRTRLGGLNIRRALCVGAVLLVGLVMPAVARGQAMGRLSLDSPSPLPLAPRITDKPAAPKAPEPTVSNPITPAAEPPSVSTPEPSAAARLLAPAPDIKPPEPVKPPASNPAGASVSVPVAPDIPAPVPPTPSATGGMGEPKPANTIEQQPIRGAGNPGNVTTTTDKPANAGSSAWGGAGQVIAALAIVVGLIFIGRALVRKFVPGAGASNGKGVIEILARHPLSKNQSLVLVRIGSQIVALNQGRDASQSVLVISEPMEVARLIGQIEGKNPASLQAGFNRLLSNARMDLENTPEDPASKPLADEDLDEQLEEMAAAKRQLMELRQHVRSVRDSLPRE
jgi:flagellar biogenesis protein FliO